MTVTIARGLRGSHRWYAVPEGTAAHPAEAVWLDSGRRSLGTMFGIVTTDGGVRYFERKRDLVATLTANGHTVEGLTVVG